MKTLFGIAAVLATVGMSMLASADVAEARGVIRPKAVAPRIAINQVRIGPRVVQPKVLRPQSLPGQFRQIRGPRESGRGVNCRFVETGPARPITHINPRTGRSETVLLRTGTTRCPLRI